MRKARFIALGSLATVAVAGAMLAVPDTRHMLRRALPHHLPVRFSTARETPVDAVPRPMPSLAGEAGDFRFQPAPLSGHVANLPLVPPRFGVALLLPPVGPLPRALEPGFVLDRGNPVAALGAVGDSLGPDGDLAGARQALRDYHAGDLAGGDDFARPTGGALRLALDWAAIKLNARAAGPARLAAFVTAHPTWPMRPWVERRIEDARAGVRDPAAILALFKTASPQTLAGTLGLARARLATGDTASGAALVQRVWREEDLSGPEEAGILREFGPLLRREDHKARADRLLYKEDVPSAMRAAALAGGDVVLLARARAAVIAKGNADAAIAAVPKALQGDVGLLFNKIQKARRANHPELAAALMQQAPRDDASIIDGDQWWIERRLIARKMLDVGNPKLAYAIVTAAAAESPASRIEAEFHAGWIALRFLNDPALAAPHFAAVSKLAATPISQSRGAYWQGRVAETQGDRDGAAKFFLAAAAQSTTFYGQLAAARLGDAPLLAREAPSAATGDAVADPVRCVAQLFALGERELALSLSIAIAKTEIDPTQVAALAAVVESTGDARATLEVGKAGLQRGLVLADAAFPTFGIPGYQPIENSADRATVLAIARQESEFDPRSVSAAGAKGLMQLIDATARKTAEQAGIGFEPGRLLSDASFNARIGAAHLGQLLSDLDGSYILTFAAYNAGAGKVRDWINAYGDPRKPGVDPVDWIERIPFTETRNYVQRVFENMQMYRSRFGMPTALLTPPAVPDRKGT